VFLFLFSALFSFLFLLSALLSFVLPEDGLVLLSGSGPGPPVGAMLELSILSLLTVISVSSLPVLPVVFELPPQALTNSAALKNSRNVKLRLKGFSSLKSLLVRAKSSASA
jgi:hypothetical protein